MEVNLKMHPDKICRTCLSESEELKLISSKMQGETRTIMDALTFVVNINVLLGNGLPDHVCNACETILCQADAFKRRCLESQAVLDQHLQVCSQGITNEELTQKSCIKDETMLEIDKTEFIEPSLSNNCEDQPSNSFMIDNNISDEFTDDNKLKLFADITISKQKRDKNHKKTSAERKEDELKVVKEEDSTDFDNQFSFDFDHADSYIHNEYDEEKVVDDKNKIFTCSCGTVCLDKDEYRLHLYTKKCNTIKTSRHKKGFKIKSEKTIATKLYDKLKTTCLECNKTFANIRACIIHRKRCHVKEEKGSFQCNMCERKFIRKSSYTNHIKNHDLKSSLKFVCATCKREFQHKAHLDNHILNVHTREEGFPCDECSKRFSTQASLDIHKDSHKIDKKHVCKICKKAFHMLSTLTDHMRVHTGEKPFLCSMCGKGFSQKTNLAQHVRRHQGLKPYKCRDCDRSFVSKGELTAHSRSHSGAHPFVCEDCGGGFTTSSSLVKHRRTHTGERPYACDLCPMRFAASGTLKNHRRTHTGEKPFQCSHCEKAFVQRHDLISHIRGHTGERPYSCCSCGLSFRKASALKAHNRLHTKEQRELALLQPAALLAALPAQPLSGGSGGSAHSPLVQQ